MTKFILGGGCGCDFFGGDEDDGSCGSGCGGCGSGCGFVGGGCGGCK